MLNYFLYMTLIGQWWVCALVWTKLLCMYHNNNNNLCGYWLLTFSITIFEYNATNIKVIIEYISNVCTQKGHISSKLIFDCIPLHHWNWMSMVGTYGIKQFITKVLFVQKQYVTPNTLITCCRPQSQNVNTMWMLYTNGLGKHKWISH